MGTGARGQQAAKGHVIRDIWTRLRISNLTVLSKLGKDWKVVSRRGALFSESGHLEEKEPLVWLCQPLSPVLHTPPVPVTTPQGA